MASERIASVLRKRIIAREVAPGTRLKLTNIANEFDVSLNPVRDALRQLERERLVEGRAMLGYRVSLPDKEALLGLWKLREAVECEAARMCAVNATCAQIAELEELAREADDALDRRDLGSHLEGAEMSFHMRVAEIADYAELTDTLSTLHILLGTFCRPWMRKVEASHVFVAREIGFRDPDRAERAMRRHVAVHPGDVEELMRWEVGSVSSTSQEEGTPREPAS